MFGRGMFGTDHFTAGLERPRMSERASLNELDAAPHARPFEAGEPTVIRLALDADERVDPHTHPEREIVLYLRSGRVELDLDEETYDLAAGDVIRFDGQREVSPYAVEDSEALIVLAQRSD
jgi:quercetin dioxygenase-like cupin family protein